MDESTYNGQSQSLFSHLNGSTESQSTQLLDFVLGRTTTSVPTGACKDASGKGTPSNSAAAGAAGNGNKSVVTAKDASVGSGAHSGSADASEGSSQHYHFYGLAETQDPSQFPVGVDLSHDGEAEEGGSESQKENTPTHVVSAPKTPTPPAAVLAPSANVDKKTTSEGKATSVAFCAKEDKDKAPAPLPLTPSRPLSTRVPPQTQQTKAVSFLSPVQRPSPAPGKVQKSTASTPAPMRFKRRNRPRSPSPASQDSFAGPNPLEDPDLFVATSKQFSIPLDRLGEDSEVESQSQEVQTGEEEEDLQQCIREREEQESGHSHVEETPLKDEDSKKRKQKQKQKQLKPPRQSVSEMTPYSLSSASTRYGRILVANSDESSGTSQESNEQPSTQGNHGMQMSQQPTQVFDESNTTSMLVHVDEASQEEGDRTQMIDETTQPSGQLPSAGEQLADVSVRRTATAGSIVAPSTASSATTGRRSLLNLVAPEKRHRYANLESPREQPSGHGSPFIPPSLQHSARQTVQTIPSVAGVGIESATRSTVSGASNAATAGTSALSVARGSRPSLNLSSASKAQGSNQPAISVGVKRPRRSDHSVEDVIPDSEAQVEEQLSSQRDARPRPRPPSTEANKKRKVEEVVPASESDPATSLPLQDIPRTIDDDGGDLTEEESEEEPLAKQKSVPAPAAQVKGKQKESALPPAPVAGSSRARAMTLVPVKQEKKKPFAVPPPPPAATSTGARSRKAATRRMEVIPSSEPQHDQEPLHRKAGRQRKSDTSKGKVAAAPQQQQRTASPADRRSQSPGGTGPQGNTGEPSPSPEIPLAHIVRTEEEEQTEIADDEQMDIDDDQEFDVENEEDEVDEFKSETATAVQSTMAPPLPSPELVHEQPRKRTRRASAAVAAPAPALAPAPVPTAWTTSAKKKTTTTKTAAAQRRSTRKPRSAAKKGGPSSAKRTPKNTLDTSGGTRVLALWKGDSHYYVGTTRRMVDSRYHVEFDDGTEEDVLDKNLRDISKIRVGDMLAPLGQSVPVRVTNVDEWETERVLRGVFIEGDEDDDVEIDIRSSEVRIPSRTVNGLWEDRKLQPHEINPALKPRPLNSTPSPSKLSMTNGPSGRNKMLARHGFIITLSPNNDNWEKDKVELTKTITDAGGTVIDDWSDMLSFQGKHAKGDKRWTIEASDIKVHKPKGVDRVFLISNDHSQKPKYLIALALGVPCVDAKWIKQMHRGIERPWSAFLLPAGLSESLGARISQMVDLEWGDSPLHLQEIMSNAVAPKILKDARVLCLGAELLPPKKPSTDASRGALFSVPRIILCMGAKRVEAVASAEHASEKDLSNYDFIVVKDAPPPSLIGKAVCVDIGWLKDCLLTGRQLPLPDFTS